MKGFLGVESPVAEGLTFDVLYKPMSTIEELGGDWYDIFTLPDWRIGCSLGDVCERGPGSAVRWDRRSSLQSLEVNDSMPIAVLDQTKQNLLVGPTQPSLTPAIHTCGINYRLWRRDTYAIQ